MPCKRHEVAFDGLHGLESKLLLKGKHESTKCFIFETFGSKIAKKVHGGYRYVSFTRKSFIVYICTIVFLLLV